MNNEPKKLIEQAIEKIQSILSQYYAKIDGVFSHPQEFDETLALLTQAQSEANERIEKLAQDHYWDSFEQDKELIMKHLRAILALAKEGE